MQATYYHDLEPQLTPYGSIYSGTDFQRIFNSSPSTSSTSSLTPAIYSPKGGVDAYEAYMRDSGKDSGENATTFRFDVKRDSESKFFMRQLRPKDAAARLKFDMNKTHDDSFILDDPFSAVESPLPVCRRKRLPPPCQDRGDRLDGTRSPNHKRDREMVRAVSCSCWFILLTCVRCASKSWM